MNAADAHSRERSENMRAIEARRSTEICFFIADFMALQITGKSPRNETMARISFDHAAWEKNDIPRNNTVKTTRMISNIKKPFSWIAAKRDGAGISGDIGSGAEFM
jgi:hypothetical protein